MTRNEIVKKIESLDGEIAAAREFDRNQEIAHGKLETTNVNRVLDYVKAQFPAYEVRGNFGWSYNDKNATKFEFTFTSKPAKCSHDFHIEFDTNQVICRLSAAGLSAHSSDIEEMRKEAAEVIHYYTMVTEVSAWFSAPRQDVVDLLNAREKFEWKQSGVVIHDMEILKDKLQKELREIDLNLTIGTIVEYNDIWVRYGRAHDNWRMVKIARVTPKQIEMVVTSIDKDGKYVFGHSFRKELIIERFRTVEEGDNARAEEERARAEQEAKWRKMSA